MIAMMNEVGRLLASLREEDLLVDLDVQHRLVACLRKMTSPEILETLEPELHDPDPDYRCAIVSVFLASDFATAVRNLDSLLHDPDERVRFFVCEALGRHKRQEAIPLLTDALRNDIDPTTRVVTAWGLGNIGDPAALPALQAAMQNDTGVDYEGRPVKEIAAEAIRRIREKMAAGAT